jgi:hypothetical protein
MTAFRLLWISVMINGLIPFSEAIAADAVSPATEKPVTADELFGVFVAMKASTVVAQGVARNEDPRFYSREWIDDAIRSALDASKQPAPPDLNWVQDSLLAKLSIGIGIERVYGISQADAGAGKGSLIMQVTDQCQRPSTLTIGYVFEDGAWRIVHVNSNSTKAGQAWFRTTLKPMKEFAHLQVRDRSRYINESHLGKALGLDVKDHECGASP